jgi:excisionase family DNA binding protein
MGLCTVLEAARRLRLSEHTVRDAVRVGSIPAVRLGRRIRITEDTLDALERVGHPLLTKRAGVGR